MICAPAAARPVSERERGPEDRERCEDGADDHRLTNDCKLGVCAGKQGGHSLPAAQPHQRLVFTIQRLQRLAKSRLQSA
jgi:hypothetical protein